ncbi:DUF4157 domain-containing protein [Sorangium sp. So ce269]
MGSALREGKDHGSTTPLRKRSEGTVHGPVGSRPGPASFEASYASPSGRMTAKEAYTSARMTAREAAGGALQRRTAREASQRAAGGAAPMAVEEAPGPNRTGLPDALKAGIESLSGLPLDDVRVHYSSAAPAQLEALAYTQGSEIHVAPGQERHVPHEAWHAVQQKQGRVRATTQMNGVGLNDAPALEAEADVMGARAAQTRARPAPSPLQRQSISVSRAAQRVVTPYKPGETLPCTTQPLRNPGDAGAAARWSGEPVQRKLAYFKPPSAPVSDDLRELDRMAKVLDSATEQAHRHVVATMRAAFDPDQPYSLDMKDFPGSTPRRFAFWVGQLQGDTSLKAAATGYMIEDMVTAHVGGMTGYTSQVADQGARPDFIISDGQKAGVVDVTSTGDIGHVLKKDFDLRRYPYVVESLYPSVDFSNLAGTSLDVDESTVQAIAAVRAARANEKLAEEITRTRTTMDLIIGQEFIHGRANPGIVAAKRARDIVRAMSGARATPALLAELDTQIEAVNESLPNYAIRAISHVMNDIREQYGVVGDPPWGG